MYKLFIGNSFYDDPSGRFYTDGDGNGEEFREEVLKPLFDKFEKVIVNIDENVEGYGSSFLVESFAGLVKYGYFTKDELLGKLGIEYSDPDFEFYRNRILKYINEASYKTKKYSSTKEEAIRKNVFHNTIDKSFLQQIL